MYKFEVNHTKIKGGCQSWTKAAHQHSCIDLTLVFIDGKQKKVDNLSDKGKTNPGIITSFFLHAAMTYFPHLPNQPSAMIDDERGRKKGFSEKPSIRKKASTSTDLTSQCGRTIFPEVVFDFSFFRVISHF